MARRCARCFGGTEPVAKHETVELSFRAGRSVAKESLTVNMRDVSTSLDMTQSILEDRRTLWVVAAIVFLLFLVANLPWELDDYDQAKQAFTSFEVIKEGHWFFQHTPRQHVATKPPFVGWMPHGGCRHFSRQSARWFCSFAPPVQLTVGWLPL
jgi:hypothetical protein